MGRVSVHRQFQINTRRSAVEKRAEFNLFLRNFLCVCELATLS